MDGFEHEDGPQERTHLFTSIENQVEQLCEIMVVICDFIDDLEESQVSEASIKLFLEDLKKVPDSSKDVLATIESFVTLWKINNLRLQLLVA